MIHEHRLRVLLVEDSPGDARLIREGLRESGRAPELVHVDRIGAIETLEESAFDAIMLDLSLPDSEGIDTVTRVIRLVPDAPIIVLTGTDDESVALAALGLGAQDYLHKGDATPTTLWRALRYTLERHRLLGGYRFLDRLGAILSRSMDPGRVTEAFVSACADFLADTCVVYELEADGDLRVAATSAASTFPPASDAEARRTVRTAIERAEACCMDPLDHDCRPTDATFSSEAAETAGGDGIAVALQGRDGPLGAALFLFHRSEQRRRRSDTVLAREATARFALALENAALLRSERRARLEAERAVRLREEVQGIIAHDLRNPLGSIRMAAEVVLEGAVDPEKQNELLRSIVRSSEFADRLISDLLDVAKIEGRALGIEPIPITASGLLKLAHDALVEQAERAQVRLVLENEAAGAAVLADPDRVRQVLVNLGGNGVKFAAPGGTVTLSARATPGGVELSVEDDGPGIPADELPHLFDRFWRSTRFRQGGAGLGLSIARGIVEGHGSRLFVESEPGVRTTFRFTLDAAAGAVAADDEPGVTIGSSAAGSVAGNGTA